MAENNDKMSFEDILTTASEYADLDEMEKFIREENNKLPGAEQVTPEVIAEVVESLSEEITNKLGIEVFRIKLRNMEPVSDPYENLQNAKQVVKTCLLEVEKSEANEAILQLKEKLDLSYQHGNILKQFYKEEKAKHDRKKKSSLAGDCEYDLDSTSGRAKICRDFADIIIAKQRKLNHPIKGINGSLRIYNKGIYPDSEEIVTFIKKDIVEVGLVNDVNLTPNLVDQVVKLIELAVPVRADECEPNKDFVVVLNNGVLDMRTWEFKRFDPDEVYFSKIPIDYVPDAPTPTNFIKFIESCFKGNEAQIELLQEAFGYCLTKTYKYQDVFYMLGDGGNGKGSVMGVLRMMLGEENCTSFSLYQLTDGEHIDYNVAEMCGKYANICGDIGSAKVRNTDTLKKLSSNTDPVQGRRVRERPFQFINYAKMFFLMNRAPEFDAHTTGDKRRIRMINFVNSFSEKKTEIKDIHKVIEKAGELPGVLLWAIEGLKRLEANKCFTDKRSIVQRSLEYDRKSNTVKYFVQEKMYEDPGAVIYTGNVYEAYNNFRKSIGGAELSDTELKKCLMEEFKDAGWESVRVKQIRVSQMNEPLKSQMLQRFDLKSQPRCFFGVNIEKDEPQKTVKDFVEPVGMVTLAETDAEAYEEFMKEQEGMFDD